MKSLIVKLWRTMTRPAVHISLGVLTMGGFIAGVVFGVVSIQPLKPLTQKSSASAVTPCVIMYTLNFKKPFTGKTILAYVRLAQIVMFLTTGQIRLRAKCRRPKKFSLRCLVTTMNLVYLKSDASNSPSTSGIVSLPTNP